MKAQYKILICLFSLLGLNAKGQVANNYSVGTWFQFKKAAVSYTFDDNCANQISNILPAFDNLGFKMTFFTVTTGSWNPNWSTLKSASTNGHEVASHTVDHSSLPSLSTSAQGTEMQQSKSTIESNITNAKCVTIAYPNCNEATASTLQQYYIAGRVCNGQNNSSTPSDFYQIGATITGNQGSINSASDFNSKVSQAQSSGGWAVFVTHGITTESGNTESGAYSPTKASEIKSHLANMNTNIANYWIGTFGNVAKYIKERNAASVKETTITKDSLQVTVTHSLDNTIFNVPLSIRRTLPSGWANARVYIDGKLTKTTLVQVNGASNIQFDVVPNPGNVILANTSTVTGVDENDEVLFSMAVDPNPFWQETVIRAKGDFNYTISSTDGRMVQTGNGTDALNIGGNLQNGIYILSVRCGSHVWTKKIVKQ